MMILRRGKLLTLVLMFIHSFTADKIYKRYESHKGTKARRKRYIVVYLFLIFIVQKQDRNSPQEHKEVLTHVARAVRADSDINYASIILLYDDPLGKETGLSLCCTLCCGMEFSW